MEGFTLYKAYEMLSTMPFMFILLAFAVMVTVQLIKKALPEQYKSFSILIAFGVGCAYYLATIAIYTRGQFVAGAGDLAVRYSPLVIVQNGIKIGTTAVLLFNIIKSIRKIGFEKLLGSPEAREFFKYLVQVIGNKYDAVSVIKKLVLLDWKNVNSSVASAKAVLTGFVDTAELDNVTRVLETIATGINTQRELCEQEQAIKLAEKARKKALKKARKEELE